MPEDGIKPTFTERPVIRQTDDGAKITFECRCVGDPEPQIRWYVYEHPYQSVNIPEHAPIA